MSSDPPARRRVRCYVDPVSPYAWLATDDFARLEAAGVDLVLIPVLFAGLLSAHGNIGPAELPAKRRYLFRDVMREAARRGMRFNGPPGHPFNPLPALRMPTALDDAGERRRLFVSLLKACWEDGVDISATARAVADGVFGVPTFRLEDELFWGGDRVDALLWRLQGAIDEDALAAFLARAPVATRAR